MSTLTVFDDGTGGAVRSSDFTHSTVAAGYTAARAGGSMTTFANASDLIAAGQAESDNGDGTFTVDVYEGFVSFDTSALTSSATVSAATCSLYGSVAPSNTPTLRLRSRDWGATLENADYVAGASLTGLTLRAHFATSGMSVSAYNDFVDDAMAAAINTSGSTRLILVDTLTEAGTAPSAFNQYAGFHTLAASGTTQAPKLVITYTAPNTKHPALLNVNQAVMRAATR